MAITLIKKVPLNALELVCGFDDAVDAEASDLEEYKKTGDMAHLKFHPDKQPTIFLCNFDLKGKEAAAIKNSMVSGRDDEGNPQLALGTWSFRVIKYTLKDIRNPDYLKPDECLTMKKDKDGYVHDDLLAQLDKVGVINELFALYNNLVSTSPRNNAKN